MQNVHAGIRNANVVCAIFPDRERHNIEIGRLYTSRIPKTICVGSEQQRQPKASKQMQ